MKVCILFPRAELVRVDVHRLFAVHRDLRDITCTLANENPRCDQSFAKELIKIFTLYLLKCFVAITSKTGPILRLLPTIPVRHKAFVLTRVRVFSTRCDSNKTFGQEVSELALGVHIFDLDHWIKINPVEKPVKCNSVNARNVTHCRTSFFYYHLYDRLFVFKEI